MAFALAQSGSLSLGALQSRRLAAGKAALRVPSSRTRQGLVVAQSYKTRTGSGLKGTGTGADPDEVQQKSQEFLNDLRGTDPDEVQQKSRETLDDLKAKRDVTEEKPAAMAIGAKWDATEEKPAVVAIGLSSFVAIWAAAGLVDAVNRLPLIGGLLEGVGLVVTSWFVYRNLIFGPDREELRKSIDDFLKKVTGKQDASVKKVNAKVNDSLN